VSRVSLKGVGLEFPVFSARSSSLRHSLLRVTTGGLLGADAAGHCVVTALKDINLELGPGARVGLIGHNGSGKSTLMRLIAGIYRPTSGAAQVQGRVSAMFELGVGADAELSGEENIVRMGLTAGMSYQEARARIPEVAEFTELGQFLHLPVRTYSAGMAMRLYFAMALAKDPEILLIDEIFGAGDAAFQGRAIARLEKQIFDSQIFIFASHAEDLLRRLCTDCIVMAKGEMVCMAGVEQALATYRSLTFGPTS